MRCFAIPSGLYRPERFTILSESVYGSITPQGGPPGTNRIHQFTSSMVRAELEDQARVESGMDASVMPKEFFVREDLTGEIVSLPGPDYVFRVKQTWAHCALLRSPSTGQTVP